MLCLIQYNCERGQIMIELIKKYKSLSFEKKTMFMTFVSVFINALLAAGKFLLAFFASPFLIAAAIVNIFVMLSKIECFLGEKYPEKKSFDYRNKHIGFFLLCAGLEYAIYMGRMVFTDTEVMQYDMVLGILIACVSFIEMGFAIAGLFRAYGKGHYYRNAKLINMCSALTAIALTEVALTSFASETDTRVIDGIMGMCVGIIIVLIAIYIFVAPRISIVDREHNVYKAINNKDSIKEEDVEIVLTNSKFYGNYTYVGYKKGDLIDGHIVKGKSPLFSWNIWWKITIILFSEILIFPYAVGALIFHFNSSTIINKLDNIMKEKNYTKIIEEEEVVVC